MEKYNPRFIDKIYTIFSVTRWLTSCKNLFRHQKCMYKSYLQSEEVYIEETNIVNIINSIRQLKVFMKLILTENQLKIIEFANYKNPNQKHDENKSIVDSIMATSPLHRFDEMCHKLNLENNRLDELSMINESVTFNNYLLPTNEADLLKKIFDINSHQIDMNISSVSEDRSIDTAMQPHKHIQLASLYEESKLSK